MELPNFSQIWKIAPIRHFDSRFNSFQSDSIESLTHFKRFNSRVESIQDSNPLNQFCSWSRLLITYRNTSPLQFSYCKSRLYVQCTNYTIGLVANRFSSQIEFWQYQLSMYTQFCYLFLKIFNCSKSETQEMVGCSGVPESILRLSVAPLSTEPSIYSTAFHAV